MRQLLTVLAILTISIGTGASHAAVAATPSASIAVSVTVLEVCHVSAVPLSANNGSDIRTNCAHNSAYTVTHDRGTLADVTGSAAGGVLSHAASSANPNVMITTITY